MQLADIRPFLTTKLFWNRDLKAITNRYEELVEDALAGTQREKEFNDELEIQKENTHALESKLVELAKTLEIQGGELETQMAINKNLERKIGFTEKREIELLEKEQKIAQEIEEARYERDSALRREQLLLREIDVLNQKCLDQPKLYKEKSDLALQT
jgi:chromosome segregation ATPase